MYNIAFSRIIDNHVWKWIMCQLSLETRLQGGGMCVESYIVLPVLSIVE